MIKQINHQNILTTPFVATKAWELFNVDNNDLLLTEELTEDSSAVFLGSIPVALDYLYYVSTPLLNRSCNIALEQQTDDLAGFEEGISGSGVFYPDTEPTNPDGTFKRLVYDQVYRAFYNNYRNPLEIFGMENIDFPLSQTKRFLSEYFRMFTIPQNIFGDKLVEGSIVLYDNTLDDNVTVVDDYKGNLLAGYNLFSKVQEVRAFGGFPNILIDGSSSYVCHWVDPYVTTTTGDLSGSSVSIGFLYGSLNVAPPFMDAIATPISFLSGFTTQSAIVISGSGDTSSMTLAFYSGSLDDIVFEAYGSGSTTSSLAFYTGSLDLVAMTASLTGSTTSSLAFYCGSFDLVGLPKYGIASATSSIGFLYGNLA